MAKQNSTKHRGNPEWRARPDLPNYAEPRYHNTGFSQGSINLCWNDGIILKKKKNYWGPSIIQQQFHKLIVLGEHRNNFEVHKTQPNKRSDFLQNDI